jgi:rubrerythrin
MVSTNKIISLAIKKEQEAFEFYRNAIKITTIMSAKTLFTKLADEEKKHKQILLNLDDKEIVLLIRSKTSYDKLAKLLMLTPITEYNDIKKIFEVAIIKEKEAYQFYSGYANTVEPGKIKKILDALAKMEQKHKNLISIEYKKCFG